MYAPERSTSAAPPSPSGAGETRNARYAYLLGRLRNRQITMEEATELFTIMQGMLQTSEAARAAMIRAVPAPPSPVRAPIAERPPAPPSGVSDDFFLLGILAMGAGAGLLAAMAKRMQEATPPSGASGDAGAVTGTSSRKG